MWRLRLRRFRAARRAAVAASLQRYWRADLPSPAGPVDATEFLVCDAEMTGLDPGSAELVSMGWVRVRGGELLLGSGEHHLIRPQGSVGVSATVHRLRDCELEAGQRCERVLERFLEAAAGAAVVFHHAPLDTAFLDRAACRHLGAPLLLPTVDTLGLEKRLLERRQEPIRPGALRLQACRERYGLPDFAAHSALADAVSTAELLLAHIARRGPGLRLRDLL
jgi:DNA polymerase-3 subunit epsilon